MKYRNDYGKLNVSLIKLFSILFLILLVLYIYLSQNWTVLYIKTEIDNSRLIYPLKLDNTNSNEKDTIIAYSILNHNDPGVVNRLKDIIKQVGYDPVLYSVYISSSFIKLENDRSGLDQDLFNLLLEFRLKDAENALPYYHLSFYHVLHGEFNESITYLCEGNKKTDLNLYQKERKNILVNYLLYKTKDRFLSYSNQFMIYNHYNSTPIFRKLSIKLKNIEPSKELLNEIYKL